LKREKFVVLHSGGSVPEDGQLQPKMGVGEKVPAASSIKVEAEKQRKPFLKTRGGGESLGARTRLKVTLRPPSLKGPVEHNWGRGLY